MEGGGGAVTIKNIFYGGQGCGRVQDHPSFCSKAFNLSNETEDKLHEMIERDLLRNH